MLALCFLVVCACLVFQQLQLRKVQNHLKAISDAAASVLEVRPRER